MPEHKTSSSDELLTPHQGDGRMPQTLAEMLHDSETRVISKLPVSRIVEELSFEKLQEAHDLITRRIAEFQKQKPVAPSARKTRRKTGAAES